MSEAKINICDCCGKEYDSRNRYHWSDCVGKVVHSFKNHAGVQLLIEHELCTSCALTICNAIENTVKKLKGEILTMRSE